MALELTAKIIQFMSVESGISKNGNSWSKQTLVVETLDERYPKKVPLTLFGDKIIGDAERYSIGDILTFHLNLEGREWNGKWFADIGCWKISLSTERSTAPMPAPAQTSAPAPATKSRNAMPQAAPPLEFEGADDLPF